MRIVREWCRGNTTDFDSVVLGSIPSSRATLNRFMDLVTVTCLRDYKDMIRQAQSIDLFLEPCTHWIIVNDEFIDKEFWINSITPYYQKHNLKLLFPKWSKINFIDKWRYKPQHPTGYKNQQVHKLLISQQIKNDYLIIDSDTFFIRQTSVDEWKNILGSGRTMLYSDVVPDMQRTIEIYASKLECEIPKYVFDCCVPFVINYDVLQNVKDLNKIVHWFNKVREPQSEFYFYNLLAYKYGKFDGNTLLENDKSRLFFNRKLSMFDDHSDLKAILFKPQYFNNAEKQRINKFLLSKGITILY